MATKKTEAKRPWEGVKPGTPEWVKVWKANPTEQVAMLKYKKEYVEPVVPEPTKPKVKMTPAPQEGKAAPATVKKPAAKPVMSEGVAAKLGVAQVGVKMKACPKCDTMNPASRFTCEVCHESMYPTVKALLYTANQRLKAALTACDAKLVTSLKKMIADNVKKSDGTYVVDESGYAIQVKASGEAKPKPVPKEKVTHYCPCCGEATGGGYFRMGHDGRVKGWFKQLANGKLKRQDLPKEALAVYDVWVKDQTMMVKDAARKALG